jgi:hypothetical protein
MIYGNGMASYGMMILPSFMKIGIGVQGILRFCLSNLNGCNVGDAEGKELCSAPFRWAQDARYKVSCRLLQSFKEY